jgi:hypothetical protein
MGEDGVRPGRGGDEKGIGGTELGEPCVDRILSSNQICQESRAGRAAHRIQEQSPCVPQISGDLGRRRGTANTL